MQLKDSNPNGVFLHMRSTTIFRHSHHTISNRASVNPYQSSSGMSLYKGRDQLNIRDFDTHFHFKYCKPNFIRERTIFANFSRALSSCVFFAANWTEVLKCLGRKLNVAKWLVCSTLGNKVSANKFGLQ